MASRTDSRRKKLVSQASLPRLQRGLWSLRLRIAQALGLLFPFKMHVWIDWLLADAPREFVPARRFLGFSLFLAACRSRAHRQLLVFGSTIVPELDILRPLVGAGFHVLDIGANLGCLALPLSSWVGRNGKVECWEPDPDNYGELTNNLRRNGVTNVTCHQSALGDTDRRARFRRGLNGEVSDHGDIEVPLHRLDNAATGRVDLIKIDVEGFEGQVLAGAEATILRDKPILFVEVHPLLASPWTHDALFRWLAGTGAQVQAFMQVTPRTLLGKIRQRYARSTRTTEAESLPNLIAECTAGRQTSVFWLVASWP